MKIDEGFFENTSPFKEYGEKVCSQVVKIFNMEKEVLLRQFYPFPSTSIFGKQFFGIIFKENILIGNVMEDVEDAVDGNFTNTHYFWQPFDDDFSEKNPLVCRKIQGTSKPDSQKINFTLDFTILAIEKITLMLSLIQLVSKQGI